MSQRIVDLVKARYPQGVLETHNFRGDDTIVVRREDYLEIARFLKDSPGAAMDFFVDLTCVDWPERKPRFDVVLHLKAFATGERLRVKTGVPQDDCTCPSVTGPWPAAT